MDINNDGVIDERDKTMLPPTNLVNEAHKRGLFVHPFTFRNEASFLASDFNGNPSNEYLFFLKLGVDGVFTDFSDTFSSSLHLFDIHNTYKHP